MDRGEFPLPSDERQLYGRMELRRIVRFGQKGVRHGSLRRRKGFLVGPGGQKNDGNVKPFPDVLSGFRPFHLTGKPYVHDDNVGRATFNGR